MSGRVETIVRRSRSITLFALAFLAVTFLLPLVVPLSLAVDLGRAATGNRTFSTARVVLLVWVFLALEIAGVAALFFVWLAAGFGRLRGPLLGGTYAVQRWWAGTLFAAVTKLLTLRIEVAGDESVSPGPILLFMRHASIVDNLLPNVLVTARHGIKLRYVLKKELLADPALDIAGNRLPNYFLDREASDSNAELAAIRELASGMGPDEGVLLYPEGTRFTHAKRARALDRLASNPELQQRAARLRSVLPPRLGGALALLDSGFDVVIGAHRGLDGFSHLPNLFRGGLVGGRIDVLFWRIRADEVPRTRDERISWLYDQWSRLDEWVRS
jgi:1-acyl-sn-glycerol-3-phosphate acyltransferase